MLKWWLTHFDLGGTAFAVQIDTRRVLHGQAAVAADVDLRMSGSLGSTPGYGLALQSQRELWPVRQAAEYLKRIRRIAWAEPEAAWSFVPGLAWCPKHTGHHPIAGENCSPS